MTSFADIHARAIARAGGEQALKKRLPKVVSKTTLRKLDDAHVLAEMTRCVFQAGFVWRVVNDKWPDFETVFFGFDPEKMVLLSPQQLEAMARDKRIIRNLQKVATVPRNAQYLLDVASEHGSFGKMVTDWPDTDLIGLFKHLKKGGARLGGMSGQRVLRNIGRDTFILTNDVIRCLRSAGVEISATATSQRDHRNAQATFNAWHEESDLPYSHMSLIAALSITP